MAQALVHLRQAAARCVALEPTLQLQVPQHLPRARTVQLVLMAPQQDLLYAPCALQVSSRPPLAELCAHCVPLAIIPPSVGKLYAFNASVAKGPPEPQPALSAWTLSAFKRGGIMTGLLVFRWPTIPSTRHILW